VPTKNQLLSCQQARGYWHQWHMGLPSLCYKWKWKEITDLKIEVVKVSQNPTWKPEERQNACETFRCNPRGVGITISRAELAAAIIYGYPHIATDSLTSMHQIKKQLSHPNFHSPTFRGMSFINPLPKQSTSHLAHSFPQSKIPHRLSRQWICWRSC